MLLCLDDSYVVGTVSGCLLSGWWRTGRWLALLGSYTHESTCPSIGAETDHNSRIWAQKITNDALFNSWPNIFENIEAVELGYQYASEEE